MSTVQRLSESIAQAIRQMSDWILGAAKRIFGPTDDDYPQTGVQPFEGDTPDSEN